MLTLGYISNASNMLYELVLLLLFFSLVVKAVSASVYYEGCVCST